MMENLVRVYARRWRREQARRREVEREMERLGRELERVTIERDMHYHMRACVQCWTYPANPRCHDGGALIHAFREASLGRLAEESFQ